MICHTEWHLILCLKITRVITFLRCFVIFLQLISKGHRKCQSSIYPIDIERDTGSVIIYPIDIQRDTGSVINYLSNCYQRDTRVSSFIQLYPIDTGVSLSIQLISSSTGVPNLLSFVSLTPKRHFTDLLKTLRKVQQRQSHFLRFILISICFLKYV